MAHGSFDLASLQDDVVARRLTRRDVLKRGMALGLSAPAIAALLAACGSDDEADSGSGDDAATNPPGTPSGDESEATPSPDGGSDSTTTPTEDDGTAEPAAGAGRGQGDMLRLLYWQAPTILNPHFAQGDKDNHASRPVLEPLVNVLSDGSLEACLAEEVPSLENGGVAEDGTSVTYKLKQGVVWSDGEPFTAEDVKFTWEFSINPDVSSITLGVYELIESIEIIDDYTVKLNFPEPNPAWHTVFSGTYNGQIIPKHILEEYNGPNAREAAFNLKPIGTGPYKITEFRPGDTVLYEMNENYREADKPYYRMVELKGGGDANGAARAALQTGETDYAWNLQVEKAALEQLASQDGPGVIVATPGNSVEQILFNFADPTTEVDGARSEPGTEHPIFSDKQVREALRLATDQEIIATQLYGEAGSPTPNTLVSPASFTSPNTTMDYDPEAAGALLDEAGWILDGKVRAKDGRKLSLVYTSTISPIRQRTQEIIKQYWGEIGVEVEIVAIDASVYFSSDAGNPDTVAHFYADVTMFTNGPISPYPLDYMAGFKSTEPAVDLAQKSNNWSGTNYHRWVNEEFNALWEQARTELDPDVQAELFIGMNDLVINEVVRIGLVHRSIPAGFSKRIKGHVPSSWEAGVYDIANWYEES